MEDQEKKKECTKNYSEVVNCSEFGTQAMMRNPPT